MCGFLQNGCEKRNHSVAKSSSEIASSSGTAFDTRERECSQDEFISEKGNTPISDISVFCLYPGDDENGADAVDAGVGCKNRWCCCVVYR